MSIIRSASIIFLVILVNLFATQTLLARQIFPKTTPQKLRYL